MVGPIYPATKRILRAYLAQLQLLILGEDLEEPCQTSVL
jgi:hypothetical protein